MDGDLGMNTSRMEAFSDGVIAIIITIMVFGLSSPHGFTFSALRPLIPFFEIYALSFTYLAIYWFNHHHLLRATKRIDGRILWANMHLLFWLSLFPFFTAWMGNSKISKDPTIVYGIALFLTAIAFLLLQKSIVKSHGNDLAAKFAGESSWKSKISPALYLSGIIFSIWWPIIGVALYALVAAIWVIPDRKLENYLSSSQLDQDL